MNTKRDTGAALALQARVAKQLEPMLRTLPGRRIVLAVSGGVDSVVMLDILYTLRVKLRFTLAVAHYNHKLRKAAGADAAFVSKITEKRSLPYFLSSGDVRGYAKSKKVSIEMAARAMRYGFFTNVLTKNDYDAIATAHTMNDNEETALMNILRGTGLAGVAGIPPMRALTGNKQIIRPMLCLTKEEIISYAKVRGLTWKEDATNQATDIKRNYVRKKIVPLLTNINPRHAEAVSRISSVTRELLEYLRPQIDTLRREMCTESIARQSLSIAIQPLKSYFGGLCALALQGLMDEAFNGIILSYEDIEEILRLADRQTGARVALDKDIFAVRERDQIIISRKTIVPRDAFSIGTNESYSLNGKKIAIREVSLSQVKLGNPDKREYIDAEKAGNAFTLRRWAPGDRFVPLGRTTQKKISDFLTDRKVNTATKKEALVLCSHKHIVWVCGLQIDNRVRITNTTKRVLELSIR
jgi:tRNA(Ile)-lysidine synthase